MLTSASSFPGRGRSLSADAWGYVHGSAGRGETDSDDVSAFRKWRFLPRRLVSTGTVNLETSAFGMTFASPIAVAPVGVQTLFHRDGEKATAAAAGRLSVPYVASSAASTSIEDTAQANGRESPRFFQLYWPSNQHSHITASLLSRAKQAGYKVLVVTLDTFVLGWRPTDLEHGFNPFIRPDHVGVEQGLSDPAFRQLFEAETGKTVDSDVPEAARRWASILFPGHGHSWDDLAFLQSHWDGPIVLKGIQTVADARKAVSHGVHGIVVSSHGGRQIDGCVGSLEMLPEIVQEVGQEIEVLFDSGIRSGIDVAKALALGAKMVLIGRPWVYGLAIGGQGGVSHVLESILAELELSLRLMGISSVSPESLNASCLREIA